MALFMMIGGKPEMSKIKGKMGEMKDHEMIENGEEKEEEGENSEEENGEEEGEEEGGEENNYKANAKFGYYRSILSEVLRKKFPSDYDKFMSGLIKTQEKDPSMVKDYVSSTTMDKSLSPDDIKRVLGNDFEDYSKTVSMIKKDGDISFGKELLSMPIVTSYNKKSENGSEENMFYYEPKSKNVEKMVVKRK